MRFACISRIVRVLMRYVQRKDYWWLMQADRVKALAELVVRSSIAQAPPTPLRVALWNISEATISKGKAVKGVKGIACLGGEGSEGG